MESKQSPGWITNGANCIRDEWHGASNHRPQLITANYSRKRRRRFLFIAGKGQAQSGFCEVEKGRRGVSRSAGLQTYF